VRLSKFIRTDVDRIVAAWETFAQTLNPDGSMGLDELRDHARQMLLVIADDLDTAQSEKQRATKSRGRSDAPKSGSGTPAQAHGIGRAVSGFDIHEMVSEYRALRASVIRLWTAAKGRLEPRDIDDLVRFNEAIDQALAESTSSFSADLDRTRETFLSILGHDLRTPLGAMVTSAAFILEVDDPRTIQKMAAVIVSSGTRMDRMVEDLLLFTRSRLGDCIPIDRKPADLEQVLATSVEEIRASKPGAEVELKMEGDLTGEWDAARLSQVFSNLIGNAFDHGAADRPVVVRAKADADRVVCSVHNEGPPIPKSRLRRIFEPMVTEEAGARGAEHLGLGLYIADQIVRGHGGEISVKSTRAGTTFTVQMPRRAETTGRTAPGQPAAKQRRAG
jgi:signal transduction histidine kinase